MNNIIIAQNKSNFTAEAITGTRFADLGMAKMAVVILALVAFTSMAVMTSQQAFSSIDLDVAEWVLSMEMPGMAAVLGAVNFISNAQPAIALWILGMAFFVLKGRPLEAIAVFLIVGVWVAGEATSRLVGGTYPSGHTTHAVTFYGLLAVLAIKNLPKGHTIRIAMPVLAVAIIALTSVGRIYDEVHYARDIMGSYLLGFVGLVAIIWIYDKIKVDDLHIPKPWKKHTETPVRKDGIILAGSVASTVYLDPRAGTATKEYHPPRLVKALYWAAFQSPFPYQYRKDALDAAAAKRKIVGLLTKHRFGYDMMAQVYDVHDTGDGYQFVTEFVPGNEPECNGEVIDLLNEVSGYFHETGFSTWQVSPGNPHAYSNFIRNPQGVLKLIDLESAIISIPCWKELPAALRDGNFPAFDDVDFEKLHNYVEGYAAELKQSLEIEDYRKLIESVDIAEANTQSWKGSERRIWGRVTSWIYRRLNVGGFFKKVRGSSDKGESMARAFATAAIERWEMEGRIDSRKAAAMQSTLSTHEVRDITMHMGAHLILSVAIAIPIPGLRSLARFAWTASFRMNAFCNRLRGKISKEEYQMEKSIHTVPVMLISLIPGVGAVAYVASGTMIKNGLAKVLLDQGMHRLPFGLYRTLHLERIMAPRPTQSVEIYPHKVYVPSNVNRPVQFGTGGDVLQVVHQYPVSLFASMNNMIPMPSLIGSNDLDMWARANSAHGPPVPT